MPRSFLAGLARPQQGSGIPTEELQMTPSDHDTVPVAAADTKDDRKDRRGQAKGTYALALGALAAVAVAACTGLGGPFPIGSPSQPATGTPSASARESSSPIPTPRGSGSPTVSVSPSPPSTSPTVGPTQGETQIPTPQTTFANIETVPLLPGGKAETDIARIQIYNGTVVAIDRNPDGTVRDFAITIAGNKVSRTCPDIGNNVCDYAGVTFWLNVTSITKLANPDHTQSISEGPAAVSEYIVVGKAIPWVYMPTVKSEWDRDWNADVPGTLASLAKLNSSVGRSFPRASREFVFNVYGIAQE